MGAIYLAKGSLLGSSHAHYRNFPRRSSHGYFRLVSSWGGSLATPQLKISLKAANSRTDTPLTALECAQQLAAWRAEHAKEAAPVLIDPFASQLVEGEGAEETLSQESYRRYVMATAFLDQQLLQCADYMNMDTKEFYQQVVLVGPGLDTRPFRHAPLFSCLHDHTEFPCAQVGHASPRDVLGRRGPS
jgi:hypothetical protein